MGGHSDTGWLISSSRLFEARATRSLSGAGITGSDGTSIERFAERLGCDPSLDLAPGVTRQACSLFAVPIGAAPKTIEWLSGGLETGVWS